MSRQQRGDRTFGRRATSISVQYCTNPTYRRIGRCIGLKIRITGLEHALDKQLIELATDSLQHKKPVEIHLPIRNLNRTAGTLLSAEVSRRHGEHGLPPYTIQVHLKGSAGQSLASWLAPGVAIYLEGDANDYCGKGLSGGFRRSAAA